MGEFVKLDRHIHDPELLGTLLHATGGNPKAEEALRALARRVSVRAKRKSSVSWRRG